MKRINALGLLTAIFAQLFVLSASPVPKAAAQACANVSSFGTVRLFLPTVSTNRDYALWLRLQSDNPDTRLLVSVNAEACLDVRTDNVRPAQWTWQAFRNGESIRPLRFNQADGNVLSVVGVESGLRLDKVLLTEVDCVPLEFGSNCQSGIEATAVNDSGVTTLRSPTGSPLSGKVTLSDTPTLVGLELSSVRYVVAGRTVQTSETAEKFDTTLVENGVHTVTIETRLIDGSTIREAITAEVSNPQNLLSPLLRWIRLNQSSLLLTGKVAACIIILLLLIGGLRRWYLKRRQLRFHGF